MKYTKFIIKNYKAIDELTVNLSKNVIPLIGLNESGKTSILQAILAFDKDKDNLLDGLHVNTKNKYKTVQIPCELRACLVLENEEEFQSIGEEVGLKMDSPLYSWLKSSLESQREICLQREYKDNALQKSYILVNEPDEILEAPKVASLVKALVKRLPNILYFDDFSDRVPESISFPENYVNDNQLGRGRIREWQEIIVEIFSRALKEEFSLTTFLKLTDQDDRDNYLSDVADTLNKEFIDEWRKLKQAYSSFSEDSADLKLAIKYSYEDNKPTFRFKVIDSESGGSERNFDISARSKGFQWFFNFIMKLKYNPKYELFPENAIYLLDEPGSYLHSSAQTELLKKLCDIGKNNTIIYCTHSQYLLDPEIINIAGIKIVTKTDGRINLEDYGNSSVTKSLGAFSALKDALHLKFGFHENILKKCILTEGITDYYFFKMFFNFDGINIIPGSGCSHLKELIAILISCSDNFVVVLDNDPEGRSSYNTYKHYYKDSFVKRCYQYDGVSKSGHDFRLEDILSPEDNERIKTEVGCNDIKNAIVSLFFMEDEKKAQIINGIDSVTRRNIEIITRKIHAIMG
jgi:predicted ATP-dependent endonuclease of OLD family